MCPKQFIHAYIKSQVVLTPYIQCWKRYSLFAAKLQRYRFARVLEFLMTVLLKNNSLYELNLAKKCAMDQSGICCLELHKLPRKSHVLAKLGLGNDYFFQPDNDPKYTAWDVPMWVLYILLKNILIN